MREFDPAKESAMLARRFVLAFWLTVLTSLAAHAAAGAPFESPGDVSTARVLPADVLRGEGYAIADTARADGFALGFTINTDAFGAFDATSDHQLSIRLLEIRALEVLERMKTSKTFATALAKAGAAPAYLVKNLATRPVDTVSAIPKGIYKGGKKAVTWLAGDRRKRAETESGATKEAIGFSRRKRALAAKLDVDPYSSNAKLQDELDRIAWASFSGGITLTAAFAAVAIPPVAGIVYKTANLQKTTNEMITSMSGGDLHRRNRQILRDMGMNPDAVESFLDNPHMSPYHKTAITVALEGMKGVSGIAEIVASGIGVASEKQGVRLQRTVELARGYHANVEPVEAWVRVGGEVLLWTTSRKLVATLPADRLLWTESTSDLGTAMQGYAMAGSRVARREIWISGVFSDRARGGLGDLGLELHDKASDRLEASRAASATPQ
jgi:hypothetical protein